MSEDVLSVTELARMVDVSDDTIRRDCASGRIKGAQQVGRTWVIPRAAAREYARTREPYDSLRRLKNDGERD